MSWRNGQAYAQNLRDLMLVMPDDHAHGLNAVPFARGQRCRGFALAGQEHHDVCLRAERQRNLGASQGLA